MPYLPKGADRRRFSSPTGPRTFAQLEEPGQATVGFLLLAAPPLVLHLSLEQEFAALGVDPSFAVGVAESIRLIARNLGL
jgi:hypothetical protein